MGYRGRGMRGRGGTGEGAREDEEEGPIWRPIWCPMCVRFGIRFGVGFLNRAPGVPNLGYQIRYPFCGPDKQPENQPLHVKLVCLISFPLFL